MLTVFIQHPWLAFVVAAVLAALYLWHRSRFTLLTCVLWLLYGVYEYLMYARVLCSGECNIRIDLLLLYPALAAVTCAAIVRSFWGRGRS
jgi:hypothetical protein